VSAAPRGLAVAIVLAVAVGPIAGCSDDDGPSQGEATLEVEGRAVIVRQGGEEETVSDDEVDVRVGDAVTLTEGTGRLDLGDGAQLELRAGRGEDPDSELVMGPVPVLESGDVLATTDEEIALTVDGTRVRVVAGSARASRTSGLEVAAYDADVDLDSAGQERSVPALREMQVPALGHPPEAARPLEYDASDPWDRRFLGEAIDLGQRLQALSDGYTQNLPDTTPRTPGFFKDVLPGLVDEVDFTATLLDGQRPVGETLIGAAIVDLGRRGTFLERWASVFEFRDAGAAWGLVALDQGVQASPLLGAVTRAVDSTELAIGTAPTGGGRTTTTSGGSTATTVPRGSTSPTTRPGGSPATTVPTPGDPEEGDGGLLGPVVSPVTDLLAGLINGLLGGLFTSG
jgi:hypothetical protein